MSVLGYSCRVLGGDYGRRGGHYMAEVDFILWMHSGIWRKLYSYRFYDSNLMVDDAFRRL